MTFRFVSFLLPSLCLLGCGAAPSESTSRALAIVDGMLETKESYAKAELEFLTEAKVSSQKITDVKSTLYGELVTKDICYIQTTYDGVSAYRKEECDRVADTLAALNAGTADSIKRITKQQKKGPMSPNEKLDMVRKFAVTISQADISFDMGVCIDDAMSTMGDMIRSAAEEACAEQTADDTLVVELEAALGVLPREVEAALVSPFSDLVERAPAPRANDDLVRAYVAGLSPEQKSLLSGVLQDTSICLRANKLENSAFLAQETFVAALAVCGISGP